MMLKDDGQLKEAIDMFHSAAKDKTMWLKAYAQVGFCYVKLREPHAAIQAFRTALNDTTALPRDMMDVLYFWGVVSSPSGKQVKQWKSTTASIIRLHPSEMLRVDWRS
ncbi:MAG: hypothetical protein HC801_08895 [Nitrospira sp.]|nr:hypothetical protein [Nitrospira sp.]